MCSDEVCDMLCSDEIYMFVIHVCSGIHRQVCHRGWVLEYIKICIGGGQK